MDRGISPRVTGTVDLGSVSKAWRKLYAGRIDEGTYIPGAFNKKVTFTSSGTFVAPVTGTYRITVKGGGAGGQGGSSYSNYGRSGSGGGEGGTSIGYKYLSAGTTLSVTIGAGGSGGAKASEAEGAFGTAGGNSTVSDGVFTITGGGGGQSGTLYYGGDGTIPGAAGQRETISPVSSFAARGSQGGGAMSKANSGAGGGGGNGAISSSATGGGGNGQNGIAWIEYYDTTQA